MTRAGVLQMEAQYQEQLARNLVEEALRQLGLCDGFKNFTQCRQIYGKWFTDHVKSGDLEAVKQGNRKMYSVAAINALRAAEMRLAAKRQARSTFEPDII